MTLTKDHIVNSIHIQLDLPETRSYELVESLLEIIKERFEKGEDILISGFGKFCVRHKNKRRGRNPATGGDMMLRSRRVLTFKCSPVLRDKING